MQAVWWMQPRAVFGYTFIDTMAYDMQQRWLQPFQLADSSECLATRRWKYFTWKAAGNRRLYFPIKFQKVLQRPVQYSGFHLLFSQNRVATNSDAESTMSSMDVLVSPTSSKSENNLSFFRIVAFPTPPKVKILSHLVKACDANRLSNNIDMLLDDVVYSASLFVAAFMGGMKLKTGVPHGQRWTFHKTCQETESHKHKHQIS